MFTVLDVSRWQGRIDWDTVKASGRVHGVMLRALGSRSGTPYIDPMFETNYSACIRLGIPVGVYYYSCAVTAPQRDAELALLHDALRGKRLQLPAAIDVEDARLRALTPDALSALVAGAARQLEHWGLYAMVYTYTHFADTALHMDTLAPFDLWLADYRGKRPARRHGMWQYTSRGRVPGISGPVDLSRTEKDYPALLHRADVRLRRCWSASRQWLSHRSGQPWRTPGFCSGQGGKGCRTPPGAGCNGSCQTPHRSYRRKSAAGAWRGWCGWSVTCRTRRT